MYHHFSPPPTHRKLQLRVRVLLGIFSWSYSSRRCLHTSLERGALGCGCTGQLHDLFIIQQQKGVINRSRQIVVELHPVLVVNFRCLWATTLRRNTIMCVSHLHIEARGVLTDLVVALSSAGIFLIRQPLQRQPARYKVLVAGGAFGSGECLATTLKQGAGKANRE